MLKVETIKKTCEVCPAQWEGIDAEGRPVYVRYRWGHLGISIGEKGEDIDSAIKGQVVFGTRIGNSLDGYMSYDELKSATAGIIEFPQQEST